MLRNWRATGIPIPRKFFFPFAEPPELGYSSKSLEIVRLEKQKKLQILRICNKNKREERSKRSSPVSVCVDGGEQQMRSFCPFLKTSTCSNSKEPPVGD